MRFLVDMVTELLREEGHDATHLEEAGLQCLSDHEIFALAAREQRIIITTDLDFGEILARSGQALTSVIVFRLVWPRTVSVIERLARILGATGPTIQQGAIALVEETRRAGGDYRSGQRHEPASRRGAGGYGLVSLISIRRLRR